MKKRAASKKKAAAHNSAYEVQQRELIAETVLGELMETIIAAPKQMQVGWGALTEQQQKEIILEAEVVARLRIKQIVELIAKRSPDSMVVTLNDNVKQKKGKIHAEISFPSSDSRRGIFLDMQNEQVVLVLMSPEEFSNDEHKPQAEPNQRSFPAD